MEPSISRIFNQLETLRDKADYNVYYDTTPEEISEFRPQLDVFITTIRELIDRP